MDLEWVVLERPNLFENGWNQFNFFRYKIRDTEYEEGDTGFEKISNLEFRIQNLI